MPEHIQAMMNAAGYFADHDGIFRLDPDFSLQKWYKAHIAGEL